MNVKRKDDLIYFEEIKVGETFKYNGCHYIKTKKVEAPETYEKFVNSVCLEDGEMIGLFYSDEVSRINLEAVEV